VKLPDASLGSQTVLVAERALVNMYVARDRTKGAIVASVTTSRRTTTTGPRWLVPHARDRRGWRRVLPGPRLGRSGTRDSAPELVLLPHQRRAPVIRHRVKGFRRSLGDELLRRRHDRRRHPLRDRQHGASSLGGVVHAAALAPEDRKKFVTAVWPTFKNALDLLIRWRDPKSDLPALANEDDNLALTSTLHARPRCTRRSWPGATGTISR